MLIDHRPASKFFKKLCQNKTTRKISIIVVTHLLPDRPAFFEGLKAVGDVKLVIPKPKSINKDVRKYLEESYPVKLCNKSDLNDSQKASELINCFCPSGALVIIDIGGYFAKASSDLPSLLTANLIGIVEDTENGHQKYINKSVNFPILSAARSPLKEPEDFLVGQSIVFSSEALLREHNKILTGSNAVVIGYGKIGTSIALNLQRRYVNVVVIDKDPTIVVRAKSNGFRVSNLNWAISNADVIYCATGNHSLKGDNFNFIREGCFIFSVTSSDDELDIDFIEKNYASIKVSTHVHRCSNDHTYFYLGHEGNAVNFIHNAVVGNYILLVQAELLCAANYIKINMGKLQSGIQTLPKSELDKISKTWLSFFNNK